ncbi:MAG: hypothetical protein M0Z61_14515 [Nitrospiraceae bacterium]|nr:hypothetical protein [Nitrospiraceae bacterium]
MISEDIKQGPVETKHTKKKGQDPGVPVFHLLKLARQELFNQAGCRFSDFHYY